SVSEEPANMGACEANVGRAFRDEMGGVVVCCFMVGPGSYQWFALTGGVPRYWKNKPGQALDAETMDYREVDLELVVRRKR
ncbi:MAG: hypothetical protein KAJ55_00065, partial [Anaerolineales bacterium]|nr:hypothetical protein [Anaerolineales bacterium]